MSKALELLKEIKSYNNKPLLIMPSVKKFNEAIAELEEDMNLTRREWYQKGFNEAMKHKTCEEC